jgi:hypothetical protein
MFKFGGASGPSPFSQMSNSQRLGAFGDILGKNPAGLNQILGSLGGPGAAPGAPAQTGGAPGGVAMPAAAGGQASSSPLMDMIRNMVGHGGGGAATEPMPQPPAMTVPQMSVPQYDGSVGPMVPGGSRFGFGFNKRTY